MNKMRSYARVVGSPFKVTNASQTATEIATGILG